MNKHFTFRIALMIALLCGVSAKGWADGETVIFSEDFETREVTKLFGAGFSSTDGWLFYGCSVSGDKDGNKCLVLNESYCKTPSFTIMSEATLSFSYAYSSSSTTAPNNLKLKVSVSEGTIEGETTYNVSNATLTPVTLKIKGNNITTRITFTADGTNKNVFIDNIVVSTPSTPVDITLSETTSNATTLSDNANKLANVTIGRTFPANTWCTLCLPFDVTTASVKAACGQTDNPQMQVFDKVEGSRMEFVATGAVTAGTPFLLKLAAEVTTNPTFSGVTVSSTTAQSVGSGSYSFIGTYSPVDIPETGWFLKADGKLYKPGAEKVGDPVNLTLKGLRAYFTFPTTLARPVVSIANDDGSTTDIASAAINVAPSTEAVYSMDGRLVVSPKSGSVYIVRQADGTIRKVTIR